jgi:flagellar biosynthetic protein FliQ
METAASPEEARRVRIMTMDFVVGIMAETVKVTLLVAAPVLLVGLLVGVLVSLFQALTQIQEMTLVFVPKIVACLVALVAALPWMLGNLIAFTEKLFTGIPLYIR